MDVVRITIPREQPFSAVAVLVVGGMAARHDVTLEDLDDVQLALDSLLDHEDGEEGEVTVELRIAGETIEASVGPLGDATAAALQREAGQDLGLRRLLDAVVDAFSLDEREGGTWVELRKGYALAGADG